MRSLFLGLFLISACSTQQISEPDAGAEQDSGPAHVCHESQLDRCEQLQMSPPECYQDECECGSRMCGNDRICQVWDDTGAFQCRVLFWCECSL